MNFQTANIEEKCPRGKIALYVDGELAPREEIELEKHFAACQSCLNEVNLQKQMLAALDFAFDKKKEIELPKEFTKIIVTNAESNVSGLRSKKERRLAFLLCAVMFAVVLIGFGAETQKILKTFSQFSEQMIAVAGFVFHLLKGFVLGISLILKYFSQQILFNSPSSFLFIVAASIISLYALTRMIFRFNRQYFRGFQEK